MPLGHATGPRHWATPLGHATGPCHWTMPLDHAINIRNDQCPDLLIHNAHRIHHGGAMSEQDIAAQRKAEKAAFEQANEEAYLRRVKTKHTETRRKEKQVTK
mmetsp:Transcript_97913/g.280061  ORF Transcript_97913/g.280061 Transcript_97913/m.280061 type:complete len:102 (+) Transcript_97913:648-953(+)